MPPFVTARAVKEVGRSADNENMGVTTHILALTSREASREGPTRTAWRNIANYIQPLRTKDRGYFEATVKKGIILLGRPVGLTFSDGCGGRHRGRQMVAKLSIDLE